VNQEGGTLDYMPHGGLRNSVVAHGALEMGHHAYRCTFKMRIYDAFSSRRCITCNGGRVNSPMVLFVLRGEGSECGAGVLNPSVVAWPPCRHPALIQFSAPVKSLLLYLHVVFRDPEDRMIVWAAHKDVIIVGSKRGGSLASMLG
jgi:hypothetical protein